MDLTNKQIALIGLGYVGLPLAAAFGRVLPTLGFDVDARRIDELRTGRDRTGEVDADEGGQEGPGEQERAVVGFGAGRGYDFDDFFADVDAVGLTREQTFATWDLRPFTDQANFVVAVLSAG